MRKVYLIFMICLSGYMYAQPLPCGYRATPQDYRYIEQLARMESTWPGRTYEDNVVKVVMYRIRHDDGSGAYPDSAFAAEINNLNSFYEDHDICFSLCRIVNIDSTSYINQDWGDGDVADSMKSVINQAFPSFNDAVTMYVLPPEKFYRGSSYGIPSTALICSSHPAKWDNAHTSHEMSHCLGNFHTHDDSDGLHLELVNRFCPLPPFYNDGFWFDACTGADGLVDTPADPNLSDTNYLGEPRIIGCMYVDSVSTDGFDDLYNPDVLNVMSYAPETCTQNFSGQQVTRMHLTLDLNTDFNNKQVPTTRELNGETISNGHRHEMAKTTMAVSNNNAYIINATGQVMHEAEGSVTLYPGFWAAPTDSTGFYVARAKDLCNNSTAFDYSIQD